MSGTLVELFNSRTEVVNADHPTADFLYLATGCTDEADVRTLVAAGAPATYNGMVRRSVEITEQVNNDTWRVTVRYDRTTPDDEESPESTFSFDSTGGTQHITQSKATLGSYAPAGKTAPDFDGAIGYDGENVNGVDVTVPVWSWQETHYLDDDELNCPVYYALTGMVNSDAFGGYQPGEVLFLGASGQKRGEDGKWEVTFKFAASPNMTGITIGDIQNIAKGGWDYLWVQYADDVDSTAKMKIKKPVAVYVEQVYDTGTFSSLGI